MSMWKFGQGEIALATKEVLTFSERTPKINPAFAKTAKSRAPRHV
jgi:hypothetical protein